MAKTQYNWEITFPNGTTEIVTSLKQFAQKYFPDQKNAHLNLGTQKPYKGFKASKHSERPRTKIVRRSVFNMETVQALLNLGELSPKVVDQLKRVDVLYTSDISRNEQTYILNYVEDFIKNGVTSCYVPRIRRLLKRNSHTAVDILVWVLKHGKENGKKLFYEYNASRASTEKNFIKRHGKEGKEKWDEYRELQSFVGVKLEYFVEKHGVEEGTRIWKYVCKSKAHNIENYTKRYGRDAVKKLEGFFYSKTSTGISAISQELFGTIDKHIVREYNCNTYYQGKQGKEFTIYSKRTRRVHRFDYVMTSPLNIIIEFNGDYWHANPKLYKSHQPMINGMLAKDIWKNDKNKNLSAEDRGFEVITVWESDYIKDKEHTIERIYEYIRNRSV